MVLAEKLALPAARAERLASVGQLAQAWCLDPGRRLVPAVTATAEKWALPVALPVARAKRLASAGKLVRA